MSATVEHASPTSEVSRLLHSPLHDAALRNDRVNTAHLIADDVDVDVSDHQAFTPLHFAAQEYAMEVASLLLDAGADVDARNVFGNSPLFVAVFNSRGRGAMVELLLRRGADATATNHAGQSPIGLARLIGDHDVLRFFSDES